MPIVNAMDDIRAGASPIDKVYAGTSLIWERLSTVTKTIKLTPDWSQSYAQDLTKRTDTTDLYYGQVSSVWGNQRSLIGFNVPSEVKNCVEVVSATFKFNNLHHYWNSGGRCPVGVHDYPSEPAIWEHARVDENLQLITVPKTGLVTVICNSTIRTKIKEGNIGMALGPGPTTSVDYYGYASSSGISLDLTYKVLA